MIDQTPAPTQDPTQDPAPEPTSKPGLVHRTALVVRRPGPHFEVSLDGQHLTRSETRPGAISSLCRVAVSARTPLAVEVHDTRGRSYLSISVDGLVRESAPPATARLIETARRDLGASPNTAVETQAWIQDVLLDPDAPGPQPRRGWFRRR